MSEEVYGQIEQSERDLRDSTAKLDQLRDLRESVAGLVGRADGADGLVRIEVTGAGISELQIEPKAMRLPAEDLAAAIKQAIADATADLRAQTTQALRERGLVADAGDQDAHIEAARERLEAAGERYTASMRTAMQRIDQATQNFRSAR